MYNTRMKLAKDNIITDEFKGLAREEHIEVNEFVKRVADGKISIVKNKKRSCKPLVIGKGTRVKINANIGTSSSMVDINKEIEKAKAAIKYGADAVMDLSTAGNLSEIRKAIIENSTVPVGTVPLYEMAEYAKNKKKAIIELEKDEMFDVVAKHCEEGVDFLTIHCGITRNSVERYKEVNRLAGAVSRGGTIMMRWIHYNKKENPLYEYYDELLDILAEYDVAISLGDGLRPGALYDATDRAQIEELIILGELVKRAREKNVTVFVEGPGHVPLNQVMANIEIQKRLCDDAPFYVLGPLVTDISIGYDHISGAIGGAVAAMAGADFLCYVTPAEHLRLPDVNDVIEGTIASKIAAHAADIAKGYPGAIEVDHEISRAKRAFNWEKIFSLCVNPEKARKYRESLPPSDDTDEKVCSMCGEFCAIKRVEDI